MVHIVKVHVYMYANLSICFGKLRYFFQNMINFYSPCCKYKKFKQQAILHISHSQKAMTLVTRPVLYHPLCRFLLSMAFKFCLSPHQTCQLAISTFLQDSTNDYFSYIISNLPLKKFLKFLTS